MKPALRSLLFSFVILFAAHAGDYLVPDHGVQVAYAAYGEKIRAYFEEAFKGDVVLRAIVLPSFQPECAVGIRKTRDGFAVFSIAARSMIWDFESLEDYRSGRIATLNGHGHDLPLEKTKNT